MYNNKWLTQAKIVLKHDTDVHDVEPSITQQKKNYIQNIGEY